MIESCVKKRIQSSIVLRVWNLQSLWKYPGAGDPMIGRFSTCGRALESTLYCVLCGTYDVVSIVGLVRTVYMRKSWFEAFFACVTYLQQYVLGPGRVFIVHGYCVLSLLVLACVFVESEDLRVRQNG